MNILQICFYNVDDNRKTTNSLFFTIKVYKHKQIHLIGCRMNRTYFRSKQTLRFVVVVIFIVGVGGGGICQLMDQRCYRLLLLLKLSLYIKE